jgi:putative DNA primase/helicase
VSLLRASEISPRILPMLWRERIPAAALTVIAGKPGLGKSTLSTTIAAELSVIGHHVLISNLEDDLAAVIRPRLDVAGADLERIHLIPPPAAPVLPHGLKELERAIRETEASCCFLDPFEAHFTRAPRAHDRPTLRDVVQLARDTRCAIVAVHHTVKTNTEGTALGAIGGPSGGLTGTARAVYVYGYDPEDEDRRALACAKINGVDEPAMLVIEHETVDYWTEGLDLEAGKLQLVEEVSADARSVLKKGRRRKDRDSECQEWLSQFLAHGLDCRRSSREIRAEGSHVGFGWATLRRAGIKLKTEKVRVGEPGRTGGGHWAWRLPDEHPLRGEEALAA